MNNYKILQVIIPALLLILITACNGNDTPQDSGTPEKIMEVTGIELELLKSNPPQLNIVAKGNTSSAGWSKAKISPFVYITPPPDGIYDFDFLAVPPSGPSATVITPVKAAYNLNPLPDNLKGVRIHAKQNKQVEMLSK